MKKLVVNKIAVLGAGVMGAQIAAHFANCKYKVLLYDLPERAVKALTTLVKLKPSPLVTLSTIEKIKPLDYDNDLNDLLECDLIIEAIAENLDLKATLYNKISNYINNNAVFCTNTSGLSINILAGKLPANLSGRFCGVHFFNPPRYQKLVELIPHSGSNESIVDQLKHFLTNYLGKTVVIAKDTPNFIANRIGVFSMLVAMHTAIKFNLGFDTVDALTGELIGRPKSATFRTADVVGLDTLASVIKTMTDKCTPDIDPWSSYLICPEYLSKLINNNCLGQKTGSGFYYKNPKTNEIEVFDLASGNYISSNKSVDPELIKILKIPNLLERFTKLRSYDHPQAKFLWTCYREVWHYAAYQVFNIASSVSDLDLALKCGFGWQLGPFELWQAIGWGQVLDWLNLDIKNNIALSSVPLPHWVNEYKSEHIKSNQINILENNSGRLWEYKDNLVFSFKTKMNIINLELINLLSESVAYLNNDSKVHDKMYNSLIIWQDNGDNFCAGANLKGFLGCIAANDYKTMDDTLIAFQRCCLKLKYSQLPVIAAVRGLSLGGGCELLMHCTHVVAATESYIGLVETGVGVVPAGGGCKEMLLRANQNYQNIFKNDLNGAGIDKLTEQYYTNIVMAKVSSSAYDALNLGFLRSTDVVIANSDQLLSTASSLGDYLASINYVAPILEQIVVGGNRLKANLFNILANYLKGGFISEHDHIIACSLADIFSGGGIDCDQFVSQQWLLDLERKVFLDLLKTSKTKERITSMLTTGRPLRN